MYKIENYDANEFGKTENEHFYTKNRSQIMGRRREFPYLIRIFSLRYLLNDKLQNNENLRKSSDFYKKSEGRKLSIRHEIAFEESSLMSRKLRSSRTGKCQKRVDFVSKSLFMKISRISTPAKGVSLKSTATTQST